MARRHSYSYYGFWRQFRKELEERIIPPTAKMPYHKAGRIYIGSAPVLRFHARAVDDLVELYKLLRTIQEFVTAAAESVRVYITNTLEYYYLQRNLTSISRSIASRFNQVLKDDNILGIIVGSHGGKPPTNNRKEARRLKPLKDLQPGDYVELRTLELGVDIILEPSKTVKRLLEPLNHTKIYWTKKIY